MNPAVKPKLVRSRAPLRLGLAGGGTDVSPFCDRYGGFVLNATIDLYAYATLELTAEPTVFFHAADNQRQFESVAMILDDPIDGLNLHRGVYNRIIRQFNNDIPIGLRLTTHSDAPPGSGLGSSSTLVVTILQAFIEALNLPLSEYELAHLAYEIERDDLGLAGGKQDQYSATFGGVNFMEFSSENRVLVNPLRVKPWIISELESSLVLYFTGVSRDSAAIIDQQVAGVRSDNNIAVDALKAVKQEAILTKEAILRGEFDVFVDSMRRAWDQKKRTATAVSNDSIDALYNAVLKAGAQAGKVSGAGGGGFMMFFVDPSAKPDVVRELRTFGGQVYSCHFTDQGSHSWRIR